MSGTSQPASSRRFLISGTAAAASGIFTVMRTSSEPACASSRHCCAVEAMSTVSVLVMDCTTTGAPPPTWILPTFTPTVLCRFWVMTLLLYRIARNIVNLRLYSVAYLDNQPNAGNHCALLGLTLNEAG